MNNLIQKALAVTGSCPVAPPFTYHSGDSYPVFLTRNDLACSHKVLMTYCMIVNSAVTFNPGPGESVEDAELSEAADLHDSYMMQSIRWVIDLIACYQVSPLKEKNIENYFASKGGEVIPYKVHDTMLYVSRKCIALKDQAGYVSLREESTFVTYHTSATSYAGLYDRASAASPFPDVFNSEERDHRDAVSEEHTEVGVAQKAKLMTVVKIRAILDAAGSLPGNWYMGEKALQNYPMHKYKALVLIFKQGMKFQIDLGSIGESEDMANLISLLNSIISA